MSKRYLVDGVLLIDEKLRIEFTGDPRRTKVIAGDQDISSSLRGVDISLRGERPPEVTLYLMPRKLTGTLNAQKEE